MKNPAVGIDVRLWSHPGIGRYIRELVNALIDRRGFQGLHFLGYPRDLEGFLKVPGRTASFTKVHSKIYSIVEQLETPLKARNLGLLHVPHFNIPVLYRGKLIVTVHDLIYLHDAKASGSRWGRPYVEFLFHQIEKKASAVLAVSEHTKNDLLNAFPGISPEKVFVTHEAASPLFQVIGDLEFLQRARARYGLSKTFVLFVGSLKEHKNIPALIRAVEILRMTKRMDVELVIAGRRDPKNTALWGLIQSKASFVKYLGEVPDEELAALYNLAGVFVLPSYFEGFGLPVLEAMSCGTPVIVSNRASLPEVAGRAGLVFDPDKPEELEAHLANVLSQESLRRDLSAKGLARAAEFSWKKTAGTTMEVYRRVRG